MYIYIKPTSHHVATLTHNVNIRTNLLLQAHCLCLCAQI